MAKVALDISVKNETDPLNTPGQMEPLIRETETWKIVLPKRLQPKVEKHIKLIFVYFCILLLLTILVFALSVYSLLFHFFGGNTRRLTATITFMALLLILRIALCVHTTLTYPKGFLLFWAIILDFLIIASFTTATVLNFINFGNCIFGGFCIYFPFTFIILIWTNMIWIVLLPILVFRYRSEHKFNMDLFRRYYRRFEEELKRHLKYD